MNITRTSLWTGTTRTIDLPITQEHLDRIAAGEHIQNVCPELTAGQREFMISGMTDDEWDDMCLTADEEEAGEEQCNDKDELPF